MHVKCGDLPLTTDTVKWKCKDCLDVIKKMPKRTIHNFHKIKRRKSTNRDSLNNALSTTSITVTNGSSTSTPGGLSKVAFNMENEGLCASFNLCPKVVIHLPFIYTNTSTL